MTERFSARGRMPSFSAAFQPPEYQTQLTPFADIVSPIVFIFEGGSGRPMRSLPPGSAKSRPPFSAGGRPLGWNGGCVVFTEYPSGVTCPPRPTV